MSGFTFEKITVGTTLPFTFCKVYVTLGGYSRTYLGSVFRRGREWIVCDDDGRQMPTTTTRKDAAQALLGSYRTRNKI